ncbi:MAG TPA: hypothetical protein VGD74_10030 [Vulgatibacter sp.]
MDLLPALITVGVSYAGYALAWRRVRASRGRRRGPEPDLVAAFDHGALEKEIPGLALLEPGARAKLDEAAGRARLADALPAGPSRALGAEEALRPLRELGGLALEAPAWSVLAAHLEIQRLSFWNHERVEWVVRRALRRALARHPDAPAPHLVRAHLEASLGNAEAAADQLARALYYARGDAFYARPIVASPAMARLRPALVSQARALLESSAEGR